MVGVVVFDVSAVPAGAYDEFIVGARRESAQQRAWSTDDAALPSIYLSHGAPPLFDDGPWMRELFDWATGMPKPASVLIVSAHWESAPLMMSSPAAGTPLVYDFAGFHRRYFEMTYNTPDATELAGRVKALMPDSEPVYQHPSRGLDHGAWVPLMAMYPNADVPVLQLSLPTHDPDRLLEIGRRLKVLRDEGVLIIGSGFTTHGLPFLSREMVTQNAVPAWSAEFDAWVADALERGDVNLLASYESDAPGMPYAHPTVDHYIPMFVTLGAAGDPEQRARTTITGYMMGLSKRSFEID